MTDPAVVGEPEAHRPSVQRKPLKYWEDLAQAPVRRFGPVTFSAVLLDHLLDLMGERHPIHDDADFASALDRPDRIVPGGFIHSITSGWTVQHGAPAAIVGMRSMRWNFVRPLPVGAPFYFTTETESAQILDSRLGIVETVRRVTDDDGRAYAIGRLSVVVLRRPPDDANAPTTGTGHLPRATLADVTAAPMQGKDSSR